MLLTIAQAAEMLAVSPKTLRRIIDRGEIKIVALGETARGDRIHPDDLKQYLDRMRRARPKTCPYDEGVTAGRSTSKSAAAVLDELLKPRRPPASSKRASSKGSTAPAMASASVIPLRRP
jgi:excisionase family DNA binding protein